MDAKIKELLTRLSFFAQDGMTDKPIVDIAKQADALLLEMARKTNTQQPVAWLSIDCIGERYLCFSEPSDNDEKLALYTAPPVPRDVLMAFGEAVRNACSFAVSGDIGVRSADKVMAGIDLSTIADRYVSKVIATERLTFDPARRDPGKVAVVYEDGHHVPVSLTLGDVGVECGGYDSQVQPDSGWRPYQLDSVRVAGGMEYQVANQPEPVNQQLLAALKMVLDDPDALDGRPRTYKCVMEAIAAAEAAQPVMTASTEAIALLRIWQTWLGESREQCDEAGKRLWDRIEAATQQPASAQPVAVPDGWQLVPKEPTRAMLDAAHVNFRKDIEIDPLLKTSYRAMLSAAQKTEGEE